MSTFNRPRSQAFQPGSRFIFSQLHLLYQHFDLDSDYSRNINFHRSPPEMSLVRLHDEIRMPVLVSSFAPRAGVRARRMETKGGADKRR